LKSFGIDIVVELLDSWYRGHFPVAVRGNTIRSELKGRKQVDKKQVISTTRPRSLSLDSFELIGRRNFN
jgi:hypothetical protein